MTDQLPEHLLKDIHNALKEWAKQGDPGKELSEFPLLLESVQQTNSTFQSAAVQVLEDGIVALQEENPSFAQVLTLRFKENKSVHVTAIELNIAQSSVYPRQKEAIQRLTAILQEKESLLRKSSREISASRIEPPTYTKLLGVNHIIDELLTQIEQSEGPRIFALVGMGGIGKTSIAHNLLSRIMERPESGWEIGWATARHSYFSLDGHVSLVEQPQLTNDAIIDALWRQLCSVDTHASLVTTNEKLLMLSQELKRPHLIVIDNLESLLEIEQLLPQLLRLPTATKFILTSRVRVQGGVGIHHIFVPELSRQDSLALLRQEAFHSNLPQLNTDNDEQLLPIYQVVGGNPLALRLIAGQTYIHSLDAILANLQMARGQKIEALYSYLYRWAWNDIDEDARRVWLIFPLLTDRSATLSWIQNITGLRDELVQQSLAHLAHMNLIQIDGDLNERYYAIHSLTRTFLLGQAGKW